VGMWQFGAATHPNTPPTLAKCLALLHQLCLSQHDYTVSKHGCIYTSTGHRVSNCTHHTQCVSS
jgi:hypothetical protein